MLREAVLGHDADLWLQVARNAFNTIIMAANIQTDDTFTIVDLVQTLEKRTCVDCGRPCMFMDMFRLERVCLSVNGVCDKYAAPQWVETYERILPAICHLPGTSIRVPSFRVIPRTYRISRHMGGFIESKSTTWETPEFFCDPEDVYAAVLKRNHIRNPDTLPPAFDVFIERQDPWRSILRRSLSCVLTPWLRKGSLESEWATFCPTCQTEEDDAFKKAQHEWRKGVRWEDAGVGELRSRIDHDEHIKIHT